MQLCRCGCGEALVKYHYETIRQWKKRLASGLFRAKCAKNLPPNPPRPHSTLSLQSCNTGRADMVAIELRSTPRDAAYLDFVRTFDCVECGWPAHMGKIESHHIKTGGMAIKGSDYETVSLCSFEARGCHARADKSPGTAKKYQPFSDCFNALWQAAGHTFKKR